MFNRLEVREVLILEHVKNSGFNGVMTVSNSACILSDYGLVRHILPLNYVLDPCSSGV